nr:hypothetical protein [Calothrix sp. MO_167.B12]
EDPNAEPLELWEPEGARYVDDELVIERTYYNGEEIIQPPQRWSQEQQLWLQISPECGWMDDSV